VTALSECGNGTDNPFSPVEQIAYQGINYAYGLICSGFEEACNITYPCYPNGIDKPQENCYVLQCNFNTSTACNDSNVNEYLNSNVTDFSLGCIDPITQTINCNIQEGDGQPCPSGHYAPCNISYVPFLDCPVECRQEDTRNITSVALLGLNLLDSYRTVLEDQIFPLLNCDIITSLINSTEQIFCVNLVNSFYDITVATGGESSILIIGVVLSILGIKRFNSSNRRKNVNPSSTPTELQNPRYRSPSSAGAPATSQPPSSSTGGVYNGASAPGGGPVVTAAVYQASPGYISGGGYQASPVPAGSPAYPTAPLSAGYDGATGGGDGTYPSLAPGTGTGTGTGGYGAPDVSEPPPPYQPRYSRSVGGA